MKSLFLLTSLFALVSVAFAGSDKWPAISHDELKQAVAAGEVVLLDVNGTESYREGHIPGAIDFEAAEANLAAKLPADKSALIVAYCGGPQCMAYKDGAKAATKLGYTNVKHYVQGISGWKESGEKMASTN
ncbi:MAG TPA: rhodanese-like domain-containing protein [Opitutaceae bacterium]